MQVAGLASAQDLGSYCKDVFGPIRSLHYHTNTVGRFKHFLIVEFENASSVNSVLDRSHHSGIESSTSPVPVYSPFLWLQEGARTQSSSIDFSVSSGTEEEEKPDLIIERAKAEPDISKQMFLISKSSLMTETSTRLRYLVARQVELAISGLFPRAKVLPFGSSVNGFGTNSSDQDMFLMLDPPREEKEDSCRLVFHAKGGVFGDDRAQVQRNCEEIAKIIQCFLPGCQDVQKILNARVPIIKYSHQFAGLECDLSMSSSSGLHMSCLLHLWGNLDWRVKPLVSNVRRWAKAQKLVKDARPTPFFTNFTLTLLVVCYLQQVHRMLPSFARLVDMASEEDVFQCEDGVEVKFLHNANNRKLELNWCFHSEDSLANLLQGFFQFYSQFEFDQLCLCPVSGQTLSKDRNWRQSSAMDIINPLETNLNISYNINRQAIKMFQEKAAETVINLSRLIDGQEAQFGIFSIFEKTKKTNSSLRTHTKIKELDLFPKDSEHSRLLRDNEKENKTKISKGLRRNESNSDNIVPEPPMTTKKQKQTPEAINVKKMFAMPDDKQRIENLKVKYLRGRDSTQEKKL